MLTRTMALVLVLSFVPLGPVGCAHRKATVVPEPKPDVGTFGTIGLVIAPGPYTPSFQRPGAVGTAEGAKKGAARGALAPIVPGLVALRVGLYDPYALLASLMLLGAGVVLAPVGAGVGAAVGAIVIPSNDEVEQSAAALDRALADAELSYSLTGWIIDAAGERPIVSVANPAAPVVDTRLEIDAASVSLTSDDPTDWSPVLRLRIWIRARAVRTSDGEELRTFLWEQQGPRATFLRWAKDDARLFRAELERAGRALAAKVVADLY